MSRFDKLIPRSLRKSANTGQRRRVDQLERQSRDQQRRVAELRQRLSEHPEDDYALRLRDALLRGM